MRLFGGAAHRVAMAVTHAVTLIHKIQMRVDLHYMHRRLLRERTDAGDIDRMVAPQDHRQRAAAKNLPHPQFDIRVALFGIRMDNIGIADVDNPAIGQIRRIILMIIRPGMAEGE